MERSESIDLNYYKDVFKSIKNEKDFESVPKLCMLMKCMSRANIYRLYDLGLVDILLVVGECSSYRLTFLEILDVLIYNDTHMTKLILSTRLPSMVCKLAVVAPWINTILFLVSKLFIKMLNRRTWTMFLPTVVWMMQLNQDDIELTRNNCCKFLFKGLKNYTVHRCKQLIDYKIIGRLILMAKENVTSLAALDCLVEITANEDHITQEVLNYNGLDAARYWLMKPITNSIDGNVIESSLLVVSNILGGGDEHLKSVVFYPHLFECLQRLTKKEYYKLTSPARHSLAYCCQNASICSSKELSQVLVANGLLNMIVRLMKKETDPENYKLLIRGLTSLLKHDVEMTEEYHLVKPYLIEEEVMSSIAEFTTIHMIQDSIEELEELMS